MEGEIKIVIVDDHELIRSAIKNSLYGDQEFAIVGEGRNGDELRRLVALKKPDVLITDLQMPDNSERNSDFRPISELNKINRNYPELKIIVVSQEVDILLIKTLTEIGVKGYLSKSDHFGNSLKNIIKMCVRTDGSYFSKNIQEFLIKSRIQNHVSLTEKEKEVLTTIARCPYLTRKTLAQKLNIAESTLKKHVNNLFKALNVPNMESCLLKAIRMNLIAQNDLWNGEIEPR